MELPSCTDDFARRGEFIVEGFFRDDFGVIGLFGGRLNVAAELAGLRAARMRGGRKAEILTDGSWLRLGAIVVTVPARVIIEMFGAFCSGDEAAGCSEEEKHRSATPQVREDRGMHAGDAETAAGHCNPPVRHEGRTAGGMRSGVLRSL